MIMDIKKFAQSKKIRALIITVVCIALVLGIFQAGVFVGFHKASFFFKSGDNFYRAFGERNEQNFGMGMGMFRDEMSGGHGIIGKIIKVNLPTLVVLGTDNIEKVILTNDSTSVHQQRQVAAITTLAVDQYITVLGSPNDQGEVVAKFIRIIPPPLISNAVSSTTSNIK